MRDAVQEGVHLAHVALAVELLVDLVVPGQRAVVGQLLQVGHVVGVLLCAHLITLSGVVLHEEGSPPRSRRL